MPLAVRPPPCPAALPLHRAAHGTSETKPPPLALPCLPASRARRSAAGGVRRVQRRAYGHWMAEPRPYAGRLSQEMIYKKELSRVVDHGVCPRCAEKMAWRFKCAPAGAVPCHYDHPAAHRWLGRRACTARARRRGRRGLQSRVRSGCGGGTGRRDVGRGAHGKPRQPPRRLSPTSRQCLLPAERREAGR